MVNSDFNELAARVDAVGHTVLLLIAYLEEQGQVDGPKLSQALRRFGHDRAELPGLERCGHVMQELAQRLDTARANR
jgi:hypothetical protein